MVKLPSGVDINNLIDDLRVLSWEASDVLLHYSELLKSSENTSKIITSNDNNPVTKADLDVNQLVIKRINGLYKRVNWNILSEENVKIKVDHNLNDSDWLWILDPLDGTKDFIQGTGNYAMHLALNYKNKPYLGVILLPHKEELWITNGNEIWCEKRNGYRLNLVKKSQKPLMEMTLLTSKNHRNKTLLNLIEKINFKETILMGSIGCKIASIVKGEGDIYISLSMPGESSPKDWDFSAPEAILKAAGGSITNIYNEDLIYNQSYFEHGGIIIATRDKNSHHEICVELKKIVEENNLYPLKS
tara:strand:- start:1039 stop:1944 length:906 start_codon:yes stop_codon:yes gene_type:complete